MSQLLCLVTQIHGNEGVTNINYATAHMRTTERFVADADSHNILESLIDDVLGYYFDLLYFHYLWLSKSYNIYQSKGAGGRIKKDMLPDRVWHSNMIKLTADEDW